MDTIDISESLVGGTVANAARPEWGPGKVLRVQAAVYEGKPAHRVSVQFGVGHRTLLVPPARLIAPIDEPQRAAGWLAYAGKETLDDRLRALPESAVEVLGSLEDRLAAVVPLYAVTEDAQSLMRWAISQTGVADPLSHWTRDELLAALRDFRAERDAHFRNIAALLKQKYGHDALRDALRHVPHTLRDAVNEALGRPI